MSVPSNSFPERLFLSKGEDGDIYVNNCQILHKSQIDGLRGLYKLFKRKSPGAILNNPSGSGKTVLVALFIEAIQKLLSNPVLILCNHDHEIQYWNKILLKWIKYTEDNIVIESTNPYLKKSIFIQKSMDLRNSFFRRNWSVLVLKNDEITKEISKMVFDADFKLWITTVDVFRDFKMLSCLGKFINPKMDINIEDFEIKNKKINEKIKTLVLLETFTEDFVVRTDNVKSILQKANEPKKSAPSPISKKNKDATGTKTKRSKRKLCEDTYNTSSSSKSNENKKMGIEETMNKSKYNKEDIVINYIDNQDSPSVLNLKKFAGENNESNNEISTRIGIDVTTCNVEHKIFDSVSNLRDNGSQEYEEKVSMIDSYPRTHSQKQFTEDSTECLTDLSEHGVKKDLNKETSQIKLHILEEDVQMKMMHDVNAEENIINIEREIEIDKKQDVNKIGNDGMETDHYVYKKETVNLNTETSQIKLDSIEDVEIEIKNDMNTKHVRQMEIDKLEGVSKIKSNETETNDNIKEKVNPAEDTFDQKMSELEANTLKKFKGSILDSIF